MNIADRIQYLRKRKCYSQEELADRIGVSRQSVSKWESEQSIPDLENVIILSDVLETTTDYILKGIEPVCATNEQAFKPIYISCAAIFAVIAGVWAFSVNRFRNIECLAIVLSGAVVGFCIALIIKTICITFAGHKK